MCKLKANMVKRTKGGRPPKYESSLKIAIAREYQTSNVGYGTLGVKYGLSTNTVRSIVNWYKKHYGHQSAETAVVADQAGAEVSAERKELEKELKEARLKIAGLEMLIEVARKELGIDIRKKPGTKQS